MIAAEARLKKLMLASLQGDDQAYRLLLNALGVGLRLYYRRRLDGASAEDAEDLVQDALIAMHSRRATFDPAQPITAWVYAIARYKLIDHYRRNRHRWTVPLDDAGALFAQDEFTAALARLDVDRILETLPDGTRTLVRRTKIDGFSHAEAADLDGLSENAAKVRVHRGLKALTERFGKEVDRHDR